MQQCFGLLRWPMTSVGCDIGDIGGDVWIYDGASLIVYILKSAFDDLLIDRETGLLDGSDAEEHVSG